MIIDLDSSDSGQKYITEMGKIDKIGHQDFPGPSASPQQVAEYSADLLLELRDIANSAGLTFLAYLIQVAVEEAKIQASGDDQP